MFVAGIASGDSFGSRAAAWPSIRWKRPQTLTAHVIATAAMTPARPRITRTLTSLVSCSTPTLWKSSCGWPGPPSPCAGARSVGFMRELLLGEGIVEREEGPAAQLSHEQEQPHAQQPSRDRHVHPVDREAGPLVVRFDQPDQVDEPHDQHADRDLGKQRRALLQVARQQQQ